MDIYYFEKHDPTLVRYLDTLCRRRNLNREVVYRVTEFLYSFYDRTNVFYFIKQIDQSFNKFDLNRNSTDQEVSEVLLKLNKQFDFIQDCKQEVVL